MNSIDNIRERGDTNLRFLRMYPFQDTDALLICEDRVIFEPDEVLEDLLGQLVDDDGHSAKDGNVKKRQRETSKSAGGIQDSGGGSECKKVKHREIEKQRRKEMAGLYASLRSLLPLQYIKGKRSISDHMHEAVSYIQHMESKIEGLKIRRDELKKMSDLSGSTSNTTCHGHAKNRNSSINDLNTIVKVDHYGNGVEILISRGLNEEGTFLLSKVFVELIGRGLNVVSCVSSIVNEKSTHRLEIEAPDLTCLDLYGLQERLVNVINLE